MVSRMRISFSDFLLNENKYYLGNKIGDILNAVQDLQQNSEGMGARQLVANAERIADQIRSILHSNWSKQEEKHLKSLQKVGVAIARAIDEKDNLEEILPSVGEELESIVQKLGTPLHSLGDTEGEDETEGDDKTQTADTQGKEAPKPKAPAPQAAPPPEQQQAPLQQAPPMPGQQPQQMGQPPVA